LLKRHPLILPGAWAVVILAMTSVPQPPSIGAPGTDKVVHFAVYLILGLLCRRWIGETRRGKGQGSAAALGAILVFAAMDELHQLFIPGRMASVSDWLADAAGGAAGIAVAAALNSTTKVLT
jgi:VanZ family protein